ncbi:T9SS type A sorting domain-containing protein [Flavobacterium sp.]|uniref:T9SS type A sorting domain-containing protein n=1 Tax=Flavobacterium sp. TaxID=239 RepID=UPI003D133874
MKRKITYTLLVLALNYFQTQAQSNTVIWSDTFEDTNAPSAGTRVAENNGGTGNPMTAYFVRTNNAGIQTIFSGAGYVGVEGAKFWAGEDHDGLTGATAAGTEEQQIDWTGINVSGKINLGFRGLFAANNTNAAFESTAFTFSHNDYIIVEYRFNGTGAYTELLRFFANNGNGTPGNNNKSLALETSGDNIGEGTVLNTTLTSFEKIIPGSGNTLDLRLRVYSNAGNEEWAVDNFRLFENYLSDETFESAKQISVYPNPAENSFKIQTEIAGDFNIVNQLGQTVKSFHTEANLENTIDVSNLTKGIYFIKGDNGTTINTKKIVIEN